MQDLNIQFYTAHHLSLLLRQLAHNISMARDNFFIPTRIVTQTTGINTWIEQEITLAADPDGKQMLDIFMNYKFQSPMQLIMDIYYDLGGAVYRDNSDSTNVWSVYHELSQIHFTKRWPHIARYYQGDEKKKYALATKVADLFDQYEVYRTEMLINWREGKLSYPDHPHESWQQYLWVKTTTLEDESHHIDKVSIKHYILDQLDNNPDACDKLVAKYGHIHCFALSSFSSYHTHIYHELAKRIPISFYLINHAPNIYWIEDRSQKDIARLLLRSRKIDTPLIGNELLTNWGKLYQETNILLYKNGDFINYERNLTEQIQVSFPNTLLGKVQESIYNNEVVDEHTTKISDAYLDDRSISITNTHSIIREVQALYNYLIDTLANHNAQDTQITDRDILVIVNDINAYAPYIKAVFDNAPKRFYYRIADESLAKGNNIIAALTALIELNEINYNVATILELLDYPSIANKFSLNDPERIQEILTLANARYGIYNQKENDTHLVSITYGLKRLMHGLCYDGSRIVDTDILTTDIGASSQDFHNIVSLYTFHQAIIDYLQYRKQDRSINDWHQVIHRILDTFIMIDYHDHQESDDYEKILYRITTYQSGQHDDISIPYSVYRMHILSMLTRIVDDQRFNSGGITFCSPIPYRSVPFKIVAMLGMNAKDFPRHERLVDFDMRKVKQLGDRNIKNNDKQLMLETLMSAQNSLYISYIGQHIRTNKTLPPSILVDELLQYIQELCGADYDVSTRLSTIHPLHNYSWKYNQLGMPNNYLIRPSINMDIKKNVSADAKYQYSIPECISLSDIKQLFTNPLAYYFERIRDIYLDQDEASIPTLEARSISALDEYSLSEAYFQLAISGKEQDAIWQELYLQGNLPLHNSFITTKEDIQLQTESIQHVLAALDIDYKIKNNHTFSLEIDSMIIDGTLSDITDNGQLVVTSFSKGKKNKSLMIKLFLSSIIGMHLGLVKESFLIASNSDKEKISNQESIICYHLKHLENPIKYLSLLLKYIKAYYQSPFIFHHEVVATKMRTVDDFAKAISDKYVGYDYKNPYFLLVDKSNHDFYDLDQAQAIEQELFEEIFNAFTPINL